MRPKANDLILKPMVRLYNNLATISECQGRLTANLQFHSSVSIHFDFEVIEPSHRALGPLLGRAPASTLQGHGFSIPEPYPNSFQNNNRENIQIIRGIAGNAIYGALDDEVHSIVFYLPNTRFLKTALLRQQDMTEVLSERETGRERRFRSGGVLLDATIHDNWRVQLETLRESLEWLDAKSSNTGSLITTRGFLSVADGSHSREPIITLADAVSYLEYLCAFLSFANGGYLWPLYIEGSTFTEDGELMSSSSVAMAGEVTPVEQLATSWVALESNLGDYLRQFPTFYRMMQSPPWDDAFDLVLNWYFQAAHPKAWPIVANAVGTLLERLSYAILVQEEQDLPTRDKHELLFNTNTSKARKVWGLGSNPGEEDISPTGKRLKLLLERIGLSSHRGYDDTNFVKDFLDVRNEATHPKPGRVSATQRNALLNRAIQWADEVLLWRIGYGGKYLDRRQRMRASIEPRYDLATRNSTW
jgi:hypothetical protein